jgi:hypothetical protein
MICKLHPPWSESPSGILLIPGRDIVLTVIGSCVRGAFAGTALSFRNHGPDSAT